MQRAGEAAIVPTLGAKPALSIPEAGDPRRPPPSLPIPRRPAWNSKTTADQLSELERIEFLKWRRSLAAIEESYGGRVSPFEKNPEVSKSLKLLWLCADRDRELSGVEAAVASAGTVSCSRDCHRCPESVGIYCCRSATVY